jgi:hypothetical protein
LAVGERYGASDFTSIPVAGVLWKTSWGKVGPQEAMGSTDTMVHAATDNGVKNCENILQVKRTVQEMQAQLF